MNRFACAVVALAVLGLAAAVREAPAQSHAINVLVEVANYKQAEQYEVDVPSGEVKRLLVTPQGNTYEGLTNVVAGLSRKRTALRESAKHLQETGLHESKWALVCPDGSLVVFGNQDPNAITEAAIYRVGGMSPVGRIRAHGRVRDLMWSKDSQTLFVLESTEHLSITPLGMIDALSGHPIELQTYYLRTIGIQTGMDVQLEIVTGIANGEGELLP